MSPPPRTRRTLPDPAQLAEQVLGGSRAALARAISLVESSNERHRELAGDLLARVMPATGNSIRVGVTGVPGVGKSTFIERLGTMLTQGEIGEPKRLAVLAIDPSSTVTGGSILGDKTRMAALSGDPNAFIRPSPSSGTLGGVASKTRESMLLCEACGFDVVLIETVGVGQSETAVVQMTDVFLALMLPNAGDELQGIKRGILELTDVLAVNKADGENAQAARRAVAEHTAALRCLPRPDDWEPPALACSAYTGEGVEEVWNAVTGRAEFLDRTGALTKRRGEQQFGWLRQSVTERLLRLFESSPAVSDARVSIDPRVAAGTLAPPVAAEHLIRAFRDERTGSKAPTETPRNTDSTGAVDARSEHAHNAPN